MGQLMVMCTENLTVVGALTGITLNNLRIRNSDWPDLLMRKLRQLHNSLKVTLRLNLSSGCSGLTARISHPAPLTLCLPSSSLI